MITAVRPYAVWLGVTTVALAAAASVPGAWRDAAAATGSARLADVLVAACATALAVSLAWLWLVTSLTVAELVAGRVPRGGGATRRLVLLACGTALVAGTTLPAHAAAGDGAEVLVGLPLPERAVAPGPARVHGTTAPTAAPVSRARPDDAHVVRVGDSLWSVARAHPAPGVGVEDRWRAIWQHNRAVVGDDPDLIHPGQVLRLPGHTTDPHDAEDGERR